ncbi:hypothetical protein [Pseudomonas quasicaspiana]|uniref:hypothetical protein n=1 Tax=Pseudomonas quasicaspiana TaxID=2829821 RepID=UPI001E5B4D05|nr:hypothetical protein [Pseudomonas quasicaspiana]MCD5970730.1 hypothetical protein [Pseudomonas quasicaspiana]
MAMTPDQRNEKLKAKRAKFAEKELRHRVRPGIEQAIKRISDRAAKMATSEMLQVAVMKMDLMADDELAAFLSYPRHEIVISEKVAREFHIQSLAELKRDSGDEMITPDFLQEIL